MTEIVASNQSPIQEFYSNTNIFITGGTGFLGKILLEKLLRSCPGISTIYVLARNKKGKNLQTRIDELFDDSLFDRLKQECPKFRHKIVGVGGDCGLPDLGINSQDRQVLINEISVVFHVAATVRFDEKLKLAVATNIRGPLDILRLAHEMPHLKTMVHVSTAFSNVPYDVIDEKFYPTPIDGRKLILLTEAMTDKMLDTMTPTILDKWPNTYAYTKAVAEDIVRQEGYDIPVGVFRPSIVVSTYKEPTKAWINNLYGPTGVCAGAGTGLLRALHADPRKNANIVPVDMCVNALIASGWEISKKFEQAKLSKGHYEAPIYNYESSNDNPIDWGTFMHLSKTHGMKYPSVKAIWYYCFDLYTNPYSYALAILFLHYLPAILVDTVLLLIGKQPKMLKIYKKIHKFTAVITYFSTRSWTFKSERVQSLVQAMDEKDRKIFFCDLKEFEWDEFFVSYLLGIRLYLIQDPIETMKEAHIKWRRLYWCHNIVKLVLGFLLVRLVWAVLATLYQWVV